MICCCCSCCRIFLCVCVGDRDGELFVFVMYLWVNTQQIYFFTHAHLHTASVPTFQALTNSFDFLFIIWFHKVIMFISPRWIVFIIQVSYVMVEHVFQNWHLARRNMFYEKDWHFEIFVVVGSHIRPLVGGPQMQSKLNISHITLSIIKGR